MYIDEYICISVCVFCHTSYDELDHLEHRITRNTIFMYGQHGQDYWASIWLNRRIYMKYIVFYSIDGSCVFCYQLRQVSTVLPWLGSCKFYPYPPGPLALGCSYNDDVIKWKHFPRYWPFVRGIHWSPVNSPHKGQWCGALTFSLIYAWLNGWVNNREAGDLGRHFNAMDIYICTCSHDNISLDNHNKQNITKTCAFHIMIMSYRSDHHSDIMWMLRRLNPTAMCSAACSG